jgi:Tfp pilus assembly protein PilN
MIRINLLSREERRRKSRIAIPQTTIISAVVLAAAVLGGGWYFIKMDVVRLRDEIVVVQGEIAKNKEVVRLIEQYARDKKLLQERLILVQRLAGAKNTPVVLLDGISQALPEGGWLTGVSKVSGKLVIQGYASSHFVVAELMLSLQRLKPMVDIVELKFSELELYEGKPVERFEISAALSE